METSASPGRRARLRLRTLVRGWPWYYETTPIFPREVLLRAIPNVLGYFKESMGNWAVDPYAFQPSKKRDTDGMSFFREDFTSPRDIVKASLHPHGVRVGRVTVRQLRELGLDAEVDPDKDELPGHVVVPGMRFVEKKLQTDADRHKTKDRSQRLAQFASENGVYCPRGLPDPLRQS